jgi:hypothetical protein
MKRLKTSLEIRVFPSPSVVFNHAQPSPPLTASQDSDHDDVCTACGNGGYLICCDGCESAYHFDCCDPPISPDSKELDTAWFCPVCKASSRKKHESSDRLKRVWSNMGDLLDLSKTQIYKMI